MVVVYFSLLTRLRPSNHLITLLGELFLDVLFY